MKFVRTGKLNPQMFEMPMEIHPIERAQKVLLKRMNYLLGFLSEKYPLRLEHYVKNLKTKYRSLIRNDLVEASGLNLTPIFLEMEYLIQNSDMVKDYLNYYFELLDLKTSDDWLKRTIKVPKANYLRAFLYPDYYNLLILTETIGMEEAIKLWKRYITHYIIDNRTQDNNVDDVEYIFKSRTSEERRDSEWVIVHGIIADGKYAYKNENCTWVDVMKQLPDQELKYYVCCYGDYEYARSYGENIVLTMEHTIAEGAPYCSRVLHDTRVDWKLEHPLKEFWDNFNP
jgi:hypothetical protein